MLPAFIGSFEGNTYLAVRSSETLRTEFTNGRRSGGQPLAAPNRGTYSKTRRPTGKPSACSARLTRRD